MARSRPRAARRRERNERAHQVASGVYSVACEIDAVQSGLPLFARAPIQYVCEQAAWALCRAKQIPVERHADVAAYLLAGVLEFVVALFGDFDAEHFEAWIAAESREGVSAGG